MSQFLGAALPTQRLEPQDYRACAEEFFDDEDFLAPRLLPLVAENFAEFAGFATPWWPQRSGFLGDMAADVAEFGSGTKPLHSDYWTRSGATSLFAYAGLARDESGNPSAGARIKCFRTSDNTLQSSVLSDANGYYWAFTPYYEAHYLVVQLPTTPLKAGASIDTILPG